MSNPPYAIRNYQPKDFDKYVLLNIEAEKLESIGRCTSPQAITERLGRPNYASGQDLFIVEIAESILGYIDITSEPGIGRVVFDHWVHPEHREKDLTRQLFYYALRRATELEVKVAHVNIPQDSIAVKILLSRLGFSLVRRFLELSLDITDLHRPDINQAASDCRHLQPGEENKLTQVQNRAFTGAWGYNPNTVEEIIYQTNLTGCAPGDVVVVYREDRVIGYCWTGAACEEGVTSKMKGRIFMLGVDPDYRGKGTAKKVLLAGLAHLKNKGLQVIDLTVDSENEAACALYKSAGFRVETSSLWYEKAVNQDTEAA